MAGARSVVTRTLPDKVFSPTKSKRGGSVTATERALITQFIKDQPREVTEKQVTALSNVLRRSKEVVRQLVVDAREEFVASADFYVKAHKTTVERALAVTTKDGEHDAKALDVAAKATQWAMENLSVEGQRVVDKPSAGKSDMGPRIMVGINLGGLNTKPSVETTVLEGVVNPPISDPQ